MFRFSQHGTAGNSLSRDTLSFVQSDAPIILYYTINASQLRDKDTSENNRYATDKHYTLSVVYATVNPCFVPHGPVAFPKSVCSRRSVENKSHETFVGGVVIEFLHSTCGF